MTTGKDKSKVMSLRLPDKTYRRLHAYGVSKGLSGSAAARSSDRIFFMVPTSFHLDNSSAMRS